MAAFSGSNSEESVSSKLCALCEAIENLKVCSRCKGTWYCSKAHQVQHWKEHKKSCGVAAPKAAASKAATEEGGLDRGHTCTGSGDGKTLLQNAAADAVLNTICGNRLRETNLQEAKVSSTKVQEDIAQFSANIRKKRLCNLTPCEDDSVNLKSEIQRKQSCEKWPGKTNQDQRNMPPNQPSASALPSRDISSLVLYISEHMRKYGICVVDKFLKEEEGDAILDEVLTLRKDSAFNDGQLVLNRDSDSTTSTSSRDIRGDLITWTDGSDQETQNIGVLISKIDSVVLQCKEHVEGLKNISSRTEAMVACYPGHGTHYVKHVDNPNEDGRCITCIYYLNKDWDEKGTFGIQCLEVQKMGGCLRLYPKGHRKIASVEPIFNRLIWFWSDRRNPHEVMPAYNTRYAITVWYFDGVERMKALASAANYM